MLDLDLLLRNKQPLRSGGGEGGVVVHVQVKGSGLSAQIYTICRCISKALVA